MFRSILPVFALLRGTAFLLAANGLHGLLLPLRGQAEGFATTALGLLGAAWATGFVLGCIYAPLLIMRVGHVRALGAFCSLLAVIALLTGMVIDAWVWIALRAFTGFFIAGAFMIIESWLNEQSSNESRGTVFGLYMLVSLGSLTAGQLAVVWGDVAGANLFMLAGIFYCLALLPTAVSTAASPKPLNQVRLNLRKLFAVSPVAFVACFLIGVANGAWGTLGPVYGVATGVSTSAVAIMMSVTVVAGAVLQMPLGRLSDRMDRRYVLAGVSVLGMVVGIALLFWRPAGETAIIATAGVYGAFAFSLYSIAVAHANDHATPGAFIEVSGGLLLLYGLGTVAGPMAGSAVMEFSGPVALFAVTAFAHALIAAYAIYRTYRRNPVPVEEREEFRVIATNRALTPEAIRLDPRVEDK